MSAVNGLSIPANRTYRQSTMSLSHFDKFKSYSKIQTYSKSSKFEQDRKIENTHFSIRKSHTIKKNEFLGRKPKSIKKNSDQLNANMRITVPRNVALKNQKRNDKSNISSSILNSKVNANEKGLSMLMDSLLKLDSERIHQKQLGYYREGYEFVDVIHKFYPSHISKQCQYVNLGDDDFCIYHSKNFVISESMPDYKPEKSNTNLTFLKSGEREERDKMKHSLTYSDIGPASYSSYALGVLLSQEFNARISYINEHIGGVKYEEVISGFMDGYSGKNKLTEDTYSKEIKGIQKNLNDEVTKEIDEAKSLIYKTVSGIHDVVNNGKYLLVPDHYSVHSTKIEGGVVFDTMDYLLASGELISADYNQHYSPQKKYPDFIKDAITLGRKGNNVTIYALAADLYTPGGYPQQVKDTSAIKIIVHFH